MGDAAFGMTGLDFETAVRNNIPTLTIRNGVGELGRIFTFDIEFFLRTRYVDGIGFQLEQRKTAHGEYNR